MIMVEVNVARNSTIEVQNVTFDVPGALSGRTFKLVNTTLVFIAIFSLFFWYVQFLWKRRHLYIYSWNVPGPIAFPFIGNAYLFFSQKTDGLMEALLNIQEKNHDIFRLWFGHKLIYFVSRPEHVTKLLNSPKTVDKDDLYDFLIDGVGEGVLTSKGHKWKTHRRIIMPAFSQKVLDSYQLIFVRKAEIFAELLQNNIGDKNLDLFKLLSNLTLDTICETAMGVNVNAQTTTSQFGEHLEQCMEIAVFRMCHIWHQLRFTWKLYPLSKTFEWHKEIAKRFIESVIEKKIEDYNANKIPTDDLAPDQEKYLKKVSFLDLILENSDFTKKDLLEEVSIFIITGTDTTATALSFVFCVLGMFPEVQQKVYEEILDICGPDNQVTPSDLPKMKYTERVLLETLRLFPIAPFFLRKIFENIKIDDIVYPAGATLFFAIPHIHRNSKYWPDPLKFDPDRFLPENVAKRHPGTYIPFSYGPRNCIGLQYAKMNMKTTLAIIIRRYKLFTKYKSIEDIIQKINIVVKIKDGPKVWVEAR